MVILILTRLTGIRCSNYFIFLELSELFWPTKWGEKSTELDKGNCDTRPGCWNGWSCLYRSLQSHATRWRPSGLYFIFLWSFPDSFFFLIWYHLIYKVALKQMTLKLAFTNDFFFFLICLQLLHGFYRLVPSPEGFSLSIQNAWSQTTLPAGLSG